VDRGRSRNNKEVPPVVDDLILEAAKRAGISLFSTLVSLYIILDDYKDIPKVGGERFPPIPHHWLYGVLLFLASIGGVGLMAFDLFMKLPDEAKRYLLEELYRKKLKRGNVI